MCGFHAKEAEREESLDYAAFPDHPRVTDHPVCLLNFGRLEVVDGVLIDPRQRNVD